MMLCILILSVIVSTQAVRRSGRVDAPSLVPVEQKIVKEDVLDDNIATASGSEPETVKAEPLVADVKDVLPVTEALIAERADAEQEQLTDATPIDVPAVEDCEADNIGYEIVTG